MREGKGLVFSMKYILAIDQSTSGTKALFFDEDARLIGRSDLPHKQKISENGWVAHDPMEIWENTKGVARAIIEKTGINKDEVIGIGISNQRETALVWDRDTGLPVYDAIVWQCARGAKICEGLSDYAEMVREHTGLRLSPYFSAAKIAWVLRNAGDLSGRHLCCGTIDSWLVFKMTHGKEFRCDYSNASRTQLFNIRTLSWDSEICSIFGIDPETLPTVTDSDGLYGYSDLDGYFSKEIPIHGVLGDSHGALFGQGCLTPGMIKATFGTGSSVMMNIGEKPIFSDAGIVTSLAWSMGGKVNYVLEGNINYTGSVIKWLVDDVKLLGASRESGEFAAKANPEDTTYLVPAFSGLGAP
ncbi:protein containing Carbohydrate kinase, FGGY, partial [human gut metagenome]